MRTPTWSIRFDSLPCQVAFLSAFLFLYVRECQQQREALYVCWHETVWKRHKICIFLFPLSTLGDSTLIGLREEARTKLILHNVVCELDMIQYNRYGGW